MVVLIPEGTILLLVGIPPWYLGGPSLEVLGTPYEVLIQ